MVLFLHNRYRTTGGEERVVEDLLRLVRERLGEPAELLSSDSANLGRARAAVGLLRGGLAPREVAGAVRLSGARVVHAHNLHPALGWRALAAAREQGARVVLHLHQYRLVCAIGVCFTQGAECTRCHARNTLPGVRLNCRGSLPEAAAYGAALALWQRRLAEQADAVIVPSVFARERLRELQAPLRWDRVHVLPPPVAQPESPAPEPLVPEPLAPASAPVGSLAARAVPAGQRGTTPARYALVVGRLSPEKGVDVAIEACRIAGMPLLVAGDGPERAALEARAGADAVGASGDGAGAGAGKGELGVRFLGHLGDGELARLRAGAAIALAPSRSAETFGLAVAEAMAAGLPVAASRVGALPELLDAGALVTAGDAGALGAAIGRLAGDRAAGEENRRRVRERCAPAAVAAALAELYDGGERHRAST